jgi:hypothetical protein
MRPAIRSGRQRISHIAGDPDGHAGHHDARWNSPTTIKIDTNTDPADGAAAADYDLPQGGR